MAALEQLASEASSAALRQQSEVLAELRARTGTLLAASSLTASFLGAQAIDRSGFGVLAILAIVAFAISMAASIHVLLPRADLIFALDGPVLYESLYELKDDAAELHRRLAYWINEFRSENQQHVDALFSSYKIAPIALLFQIPLWALSLADTL